jgi:hypothetical protein
MTPLPSFTGRKRVKPLLTREQRARLHEWRMKRVLGRLVQNMLKPNALLRRMGL